MAYVQNPPPPSVSPPEPVSNGVNESPPPSVEPLSNGAPLLLSLPFPPHAEPVPASTPIIAKRRKVERRIVEASRAAPARGSSSIEDSHIRGCKTRVAKPPYEDRGVDVGSCGSAFRSPSI